MLDVNGMAMIVKNAGKAISNFSQLIKRIDCAIKDPTMIKAGAVTSGVTTLNNGEKNKLRPNIPAITNEVKPVRPPTAIPAEDST